MEPNAKHVAEDSLVSLAIARLGGEATSGAVEEHLRTCRVCSERLEFFLQFYTLFASELEQRRQAASVTVIPFSMFQPYPHPGSERFGDTELILAAKEMSNADDRFVTVATFSSANPPAVLRVLEDRQEHRFKIFILSDIPEIRNHVRVALADDNGRTFTATTNEEGMAFVAVPVGFDWAHSHVAVSATIASDGSFPHSS